MLQKDEEEHLAHTVFVLQLVLLEGVAADGGYDIQSIQALSWLRLAHLTLRQGTNMFVALQQVFKGNVRELHVHKTWHAKKGCGTPKKESSACMVETVSPTWPMSSRAIFCTVATAPLLPFLTALSSTSLNSASLCQGIAAEPLQQPGVRC